MEMSLMERFANPDLFSSLSFGEKMAGAGVTTLMGMGITFLVLILLWVIIAQVLGRIAGTKPKAEAKKLDAAAPAAAVAAPAAAAAVAAPAAQAAISAPAGSEDAQIAAVIAAALAAYQEETAGPDVRTDLIVRKIYRVGGAAGMPAWRRSGNNECIDSRRR